MSPVAFTMMISLSAACRQHVHAGLCNAQQALASEPPHHNSSILVKTILIV